MSRPTPDVVAVLGAGTMAPGIAVAFAEAGCRVGLWGRTRERVDGALDRAGEHAAFLHEQGLGPPAEEVAARIGAAEDLDECAEAGLVVEAVAEDLGLKRELFARLDRMCPPSTLLATNTSGLRVTDVADGLRRAERVVAMHFWNPAHLMPIVEVAGGARTSPEAVARARDIAASIGKLPVTLSHDVLGFLGTRMQQAVVREAVALLDAGVASAADIDLAVRASFGIRFPVIGPLESSDLSGLDVIESIHRYLLPDLDRSAAPQPGLAERVARGELGVKSGRGFHEWPPEVAAAVVRRRDEELVRRLRWMREEGLITLPNASRTTTGGPR